MKVWNMENQQWQELKSWMRHCPYIDTNILKFSDDDWEKLIKAERTQNDYTT